MTKDANEVLRKKGKAGVRAAIEAAEEIGAPKGDDLAGLRFGSLLAESFGRFRNRRDKVEQPIPLPWETVNGALRGGLWPGSHVLVGNVAAGKSQFAAQAAFEAAEKGAPVLYVALELGRLDLVARFAGIAADARWSDVLLGNPGLDLDVVERRAREVLGDRPLYLETREAKQGWEPAELRPRVEAIRRRHAGERRLLVVLDFLQLTGGPGDSLRERIGAAAYQCRMVAREFEASVLVLSSTSRENYGTLDGDDEPKYSKNGKKIPPPKPPWEKSPAHLIGLGKESGEIEAAADSVLVLAREPWPGDKPPEGGSVVRLGVAKLRYGPVSKASWCELRFNGSKFTEPTAKKKGLSPEC